MAHSEAGSPSSPHVEAGTAQPYVGVTGQVTMTTIPQIADRIPEVIATVTGRGVAPAGAPFLRYQLIDMARELVIQAGVPVAPGTEAIDGLAGDTLPDGRYLVVVHHGPPDGLADATAGLLAWADARNLAFDARQTSDGEVSVPDMELSVAQVVAHAACAPLSEWDGRAPGADPQ